MTGYNRTMTAVLKAPFPWFGGKSRVADLVWDQFGDVPNYVEPFAGSLAVLLGRPTEPKIETVNDLDCWIANFWRALQADPERLARWADWPVNEADLHARHLWLVGQKDFRERVKTDPVFYDVKIAGWWVWGICQWIGAGWCAKPYSNLNRKLGRANGTPQRERPAMQPQGVHGRQGIHQPSLTMPNIDGRGGKKINGHPGKRKAQGAFAGIGRWGEAGVYGWFEALADRLRRVRGCCGDWTRVLGPAPTTCIGTTAVFLDPPYAVEERADVYAEESRDVAHQVREWAISNGTNPDLRIALCGYKGEHEMPESWDCVAWKANGGFANNGQQSQGRENAGRERIWFSPYCLNPQERLFR
jgi:site-specific DNA-adenine methylase